VSQLGVRAVAGDYTFTAALTTLLSLESLLFAAFTLATNMTSPVAGLRRRWPLPPKVIVGSAVVLLTVVAFGAVMAWIEVFVRSGWPERFAGGAIAVAVVSAAVFQPILATLLALSLRREKRSDD
jgi:hypothetical protein